MVEVELVDAVAIHLAVALLDEPAAFPAKHLEVARGHDVFEDEEAVVDEAAGVLVRDLRGWRGHIALLVGDDQRIPRAAAGVFSRMREFLSFLAMTEDLGLRRWC